VSEPGPTLFDRVDSNLGFLILEVTSQVENVRGFLRQPSTAAMRRIVGRDDYVDSLKRLVEEQCFRSFYETQGCAEPTTNLLRATITVAENLERLGDLCLNVVRQSTHLKNPTYLNEPVLDESLNEVLAALQLVRHALTARNVPLAMRICKAEKELDLKYTSTFESILSSLDCSPSREDSLTFLNIVHYIERMGDLLLNIGEAIVFAAVGARMKLGDYVALADMLDVADEFLYG
jgi:phosphate uptake regulator